MRPGLLRRRRRATESYDARLNFCMPPSADDPLSPLSALEKQMGLLAPTTPEMDVEGIPDSDPDETPEGRRAVQYGRGDELFASPSPRPAPTSASVGDGDIEPADSSFDSGGMNDGLLGLLGGVLGGGGDGGPGPGAMIAQLEAMADDFERQSGEPEVEIRAKIAMLRSVLEARPGAVASQRSRMESAMAALDADDGAEQLAITASGETAALQSSLGVAASIEADLGRVDTMLRADPETAAMVAGIVHGATAGRRSSNQTVEAKYEY